MTKRVVLAMSGGVDSSVAALLLKQQGFEVIGIFMRSGIEHEASDCDSPVPGRASKKGCCSAGDATDARRVADRLDVPFYALDFAADFDRLIDYFVDEYVAGRTPNPCVMCNSWLKFGELWSYGRRLDADYLATGHYAQMVSGPDGAELHAAVDPDKDQTYVLFGIDRRLLPRLLFPVGGHSKAAIRQLARAAGLPVSEKPDSQEICFVPDGDHSALVRRRRPQLQTAGVIVDSAGNELARHDGYERFTIGQRKGLGFAAGERRYVLEIVPEQRLVVVGRREECQSAGLIAARTNWLIEEPQSPLRCQVKVRYRSRPAAATVRLLPGGRARVEFDEPQLAIATGQAAVFYDGSRVLGGGWIDATL